MLVRTFQLGDYIEVSTLFEDNLSGACLEETIASFAKQLYIDSDLIIVAHCDDGIIGVIIGTIRHQRGICYRIAVKKSFCNKGIEKALIETLVLRFQNRHVVSIGILMDEANAEVMEIYHSLGFRNEDFITQTV